MLLIPHIWRSWMEYMRCIRLNKHKEANHFRCNSLFMLCKHTVSARDAIVRCITAHVCVWLYFMNRVRSCTLSFVTNSELKTMENWFAVSFPPKTVNLCRKIQIECDLFSLMHWLIAKMYTNILGAFAHTHAHTNNIIKMRTRISKSRLLLSISMHRGIVMSVSYGDDVAFANHYHLETFESLMMIFFSLCLASLCVFVCKGTVKNIFVTMSME